MAPREGFCVWTGEGPFTCASCGITRGRQVVRRCGQDGVEWLPCVHRGDKLPNQIKINCGTCQRFVDAFRCAVHRLCIKAGTIEMEPERTLIKVCVSCDERQASQSES